LIGSPNKHQTLRHRNRSTRLRKNFYGSAGFLLTKAGQNGYCASMNPAYCLADAAEGRVN
jgi:hypothetical protein